MSEKLTSLLAACAVTVVVFAATSPAIAKDRAIIVTATGESIPVRLVSYRDLNLVKAQGESMLVKRVRYAVKNVCTESVPGGLYFQQETVACRADAWNGARPQIVRAVARAREIALQGWSSIAPVAMTISVR